ncbi:MAG: plasmid mobilization relaxosome protein MobC [Clostridia bacterium]|nr:plasmid mobilization relaxosome protein MobC [Clostridia bacterium]
MKKNYNTPKRKHYVKTMLSEEERADFDERLAITGLPQSEFIRQAIFTAQVKTTVEMECNIEQLERLIAEYGKIGSNLNQIARYFNSGGTATQHIITDIRTAILDLDDLKFDILKIVGDAYGCH